MYEFMYFVMVHCVSLVGLTCWCMV